MLDINEVSTATGLTVNLIRKYINRSNNLLSPYLKRGEFNRLLFDSDCVAILSRINHLRGEGIGYSEIVKQLSKELNRDEESNETSSETIQSNHLNKSQTPIHPAQTNSNDLVLNLNKQIEEKNNQIAEITKKREDELKKNSDLKDEIVGLNFENTSLKGDIKLLPLGKSPKEIRADYEKRIEEEREIARIEKERLKIWMELKTMKGLFKGKRKKQLTQKLDELLK